MIEKLKNDIRNGNVILFVGAGVSATLGLPTWNELINEMANMLGYDKEIFELYGDSLLLAEYYSIKHDKRIGNLRSWMERNWIVPEEKIRSSKVHNLIVDLKFSTIYTTNYDSCLEQAFNYRNEKFKKIVSVSDMVCVNNNKKEAITEIIKFHGDTIDDNSIVLTESSYFDRLNFDSPLDIKLRSDMLYKSILFIGYSLSDINIRLLIYRIDQLWKDLSNKPNSYIFLSTPNPILEEVLLDRGIIPIIGLSTDKKESLEQFLEDLKYPN